MRLLADRARIEQFVETLGREADADTRVYLTEGATAVLHGWRVSTVDVDIRIEPENDALLRAIPNIKERLQINVELASPLEFIPVPNGWEERSPFIKQVGRAFFHHFDLQAQALSKIQRNHEQDRNDVDAMLRLGLVKKEHLWSYFQKIEPTLYRYPAIDPPSFRRRVGEYVEHGVQHRSDRDLKR